MLQKPIGHVTISSLCLRYVKSTDSFTDLFKRLPDIKEIVQTLIIDISSKEVKFCDKTKRVTALVEDARTTVNQHFDRIQNEIMNEIRKNEIAQIKRINKSVKDFE